ncbi:MAG TPA: tRNA (adenosine(37)-N6)-threonylcarbamoyltransferase complex dimerization subunit type 1 TsaB [Rhizomicrobium sp.]|jgi:tRNA threonylcarbamoyladenosine biosynthesis protein TsaB|nr:tRNA (adenosine(37)-N6)-threonylcarbamoyltransferase complex dimerization subunit type 1 TsaB [Rhizomicrobium sp.]
MKLLAVDTALGACSAAVLDGETTLAHAFETMERGHAERLAPMVQNVMSSAGIGFEALGRLAVTIGPGTFTGQRVGYAFMRGLRLALHLPLVGITTLSAMAHAAIAETGVGAAAVVHDAKRDEVYFTLVTMERTVIPDGLVWFGEAVRMILEFGNNSGTRLSVAGTAARQAAGVLQPQGGEIVVSEIAAPDALWVARLALIAPEPTAVPRPLYLRAPDARLPATTP